MTQIDQIYEILVGQKIYSDGAWHVFDEHGVELPDPGGVMWRANPGALLMWPREVTTTLSYADANARGYGKKRTSGYGREFGDADEMRRQIALMRQIEAEDEIVLALVMAAVPLMGDDKWRH